VIVTVIEFYALCTIVMDDFKSIGHEPNRIRKDDCRM
jgi:hypothetical protein